MVVEVTATDYDSLTIESDNDSCESTQSSSTTTSVGKSILDCLHVTIPIHMI
jgi:hypothetical protein